MAWDRIVAGGRVVTPSGVIDADVAIAGGKIAAVGSGLAELAGGNVERIDARGHLVLPGVIDVHVHLELDIDETLRTSDDWRSGTRAAARGGVTTLIDFTSPVRRDDGTYQSLSESADEWFRKAEPKALIDYTFHIAITNWREHQREVPAMVKRGFTTFKEYMIYGARGLQSDDAAIYSTLETLRELDAMLLVHAESPLILDEFVARYHRKDLMKKYGAQLHALSRPPIVECEAIQRIASYCEETKGRLYVVHVSTGRGAQIIRDAQTRGVPILGETCPHFLTLDESVFRRPDGHLFACAPQVKTKVDQAVLWDALGRNTLSVVSTDTCTFTKAQKGRWKGDFTRIPCGLPGLETLLPLVYTHGVLKGRLSIEEMVRKLSANPARIMGLDPRKGAIMPGSDADLAIIHPTKRMKVDPKAMETNADWSPYEGQSLAGFARTTISRGDVIVDDYKVVGREGRGEWLARKRAGL